MSFIFEFFKILWTLPQTLLGWLVIILLRAKKDSLYGDANIYSCTSSWFSGVSLGQTIILESRYFSSGRSAITIKHEYGHTIQSYILGPLYLLIIGMPSMINNLIARVNPDYAEAYYTKYPEKWADDLGGVIRKMNCEYRRTGR